MLAIARQQIHAGHVISRNQPLNLIQNRSRIERAHLRLQSMSLKPYRVTVGLARLRSARLPHVRMRSAAKRYKLADVEAHSVREAHDHFEIALRSCDLASFLNQLQVAASIGERA